MIHPDSMQTTPRPNPARLSPTAFPVKNAAEKLKLDIRNFRIGRLDTRYLIDSRNTLTNVRLQKVQTEIELNQLYIEYLSTADKMLKRFPGVMKRMDVQ